MSPNVKAFVFQLVCFAILFISSRYIIDRYTMISEFWVAGMAFVISTLLSPKFQAVRTPQGNKLFMKWIFMSGVREIK